MTTTKPNCDAEYDVDHFIEKFEAIPERLWTVGYFRDMEGRHCALGHCGKNSPSHWTEEARALARLVENFSLLKGRYTSVVAVNDGELLGYQQPTAKARVLALLQDIKNSQGLTPATP